MDTSPYAYEHVLRNTRQSRTSGGAMAGARYSHHIYAPLIWLYDLIVRLTAGDKDVMCAPILNGPVADGAPVKKAVDWTSVFERKPSCSRKLSSLRQRKQMMLEVIRIRQRIYIDKILYGGLTPTQKLEKKALMSVDGRVRVYHFIFWTSRRYREAVMALVGTFGWSVAAPAVTQGGLSMTQLPPD